MYITKEEAIQALKNGENIAIPTETVYGLAGRYDSIKAIKGIFAKKKRPKNDPLICHISSLEMLSEIANPVSDMAFKLAKDFWPGPLTIILPKKTELNPLITAGMDTVAVRMPKHETCLDIIAKVGAPLCAPSANLFGKTSPSLAEHVEKEFAGEIKVLDGGPCKVGIESTIIRLEGEEIEILRPGNISKQDFEKKSYKIKTTNETKNTGPGSMLNHYQPKNPFYLVEKNKLKEIKNWQDLKEWVLEEEPETAAMNLYKNLRDHSEKNQKGFYTLYQPELGDKWDAIWDRLKKASFRKDLVK